VAAGESACGRDPRGRRIVAPRREEARRADCLSLNVLWSGFLGGPTMDIVFACCGGLDIHKDTIVVCVRRLVGGAKRKAENEVRTFHTMTELILALGAKGRGNPCGHGIDRGLLETDLEPARGRTLPVVAGQCPSTSSRFPAARQTSSTARGSPNCSSADCCGAVSCRRPPNVSGPAAPAPRGGVRNIGVCAPGSLDQGVPTNKGAAIRSRLGSPPRVHGYIGKRSFFGPNLGRR
jgi:hypothetical protein